MVLGRGQRSALWAIPVSDLAGVARHALDVAMQGIPGWELAFLCPPGDLADALRSAGADVDTAAFGPAHGLRASASSLHAALRRHRPRVVHSHLSYADIVTALVHPPRVRAVTTEHGIAADDLVYHGSSHTSRTMAAVHRLRFRRVDAVVAVSAATADAMRAKWGVRQRIHVVPNGVDATPAPPVLPPGLRVLSLARLAPEKRLPDLIRAFAVVAAAHPSAQLTVAGVGDLDAALRAQARDLGIGARVAFPGYVDARQALADADVVAMLSVWENCSYSLLDAAVAGLGVVASPVGGNPEILPSHCLADPARPEAVAAAIVEQGLDPARRPALRDWPSVADMCADLGRIYDRIAA